MSHGLDGTIASLSLGLQGLFETSGRSVDRLFA